MTRPKKKTNSFFDKHKFDKNKLEKLFNEPGDEGAANDYLNELAQDINASLDLNFKTKAKKKDSENKALKQMKKSFKKKETQEEEPAPAAPQAPKEKEAGVDVSSNSSPTKKKRGQLLNKTARTKADKSTTIATSTFVKKKKLIDLAAIKQRVKTIISASKSDVKKSAAKNKEKALPKDLQSRSAKASEDALKERESKVTDLSNKKGNVT